MKMSKIAFDQKYFKEYVSFIIQNLRSKKCKKFLKKLGKCQILTFF